MRENNPWGDPVMLSDPLSALLAELCTKFSAGPGLNYSHLKTICNLGSLTHLRLDLAQGPPPNKMHKKLLDDLTAFPKLTNLMLGYLAVPPAAMSKLAPLCLLTELCIGAALRTTQDFSNLTQVKFLGFSQHQQACVPVKLPEGKNVALKQLNLLTHVHLFGLSNATNIESIAVCDCQHTLGTVQWPQSLPCLKEIFFGYPHIPEPFTALPEQWQFYTGLQTLCTPAFAAADLPSWFTALQCLKCVEMKTLSWTLSRRPFQSCCSYRSYTCQV